MALPPPPEGFAPDPLSTVQGWGVDVSSGYRNPRRNKRVGGVKDSEHLDADALDLTPGKSGMSMRALENRARAFARSWPGAKVLNEGDHVHMQLPGWGEAPGLPAPPPGFERADVAASRGAGRNHDGDTVGLTQGGNGRLLGVDAFELNQTARTRSGETVPVGRMAQEALAPFAGGTATPTGAKTYGRPVVTLEDGGQDAGEALLRQGLGVAAPDYIRNDPERFRQYMEAERLARLNQLGAHGNTYQTPDSFRDGNPDPWARPENAAPGERGVAVFADEPTPFQGLRPEVAEAYREAALSAKSPEDLVAFAQQFGGNLPLEAARQWIKERDAAGGNVAEGVQYIDPPRLATDPGDGKLGTTLRGLADPINMIDELGGIADTLGATGGRESIWNSDRRFGDILWNNIDQNRDILRHDEATHPYYRLGGQLASGIIIPIGGGARTIPALMRVGAIEGGLAGAGAGEGGLVERAPNAAVGTVLGMAGGAVLGGAIAGAPAVVNAGRRLLGREAAPGVADDLAQAAAYESAPVANDGAQAAGPTPAARNQQQGGMVQLGDDLAARYPDAVVDLPDGSKGIATERLPDDVRAEVERFAAMDVEDEGAELVGPVAELERQRDYINVGDLPPLPPGFTLEDTVGGLRRMDEAASPEQMAAMAGRITPDDVRPLPENRVPTMEEDDKANPSTIQLLEAPDPKLELGVRTIGSSTDLFKGTKIRGPFDVSKQIRRWGGVQDQGGELSHLGITNKPRKLEFGSNEQFLGRLINNETDGPKRGLTLDEVGERLYDEGWLNERPTVAEVVDILGAEHRGESLYHPESLDEVARFRDAQAEADRIAKAADEGAPLAEEVGEPRTFADMDDTNPPAIAYEDLGGLGGKAGNIDVTKLESRGDIRRALHQTEKLFGGFDASRRGKVTQAETEALASELGMKADDLLKRRQGQALNAEQAVQARRILAKSAEDLVKLAEKARGGSEADLMAFRRGMLRHAAIQEQVTGATAEAGRALASFKIAAKASKHRERVLQGIIEGAGGRDSLEDAAQAIIDLQRVPGSLNKFARDAAKPTWKDKAVELWYNSLLSGPKTHAVNILSNSITSMLQLPEHAAAAGLGALRGGAAKAAGKTATDRVLISELGPRMVGLLQGAHEGLRAFKYTLRTGKVPDHVSKVEAAQQEAIGGLKGKIIRTPTRLLSAEDEFFKAVARRQELAGLAVRTARSEGLKGEALAKRIDELTRNPTEGMVERSLDYARYLTFQRPLGPFGQDVQRWTARSPILKLFLPFVRTPTNLLKFALERSPAAPVLREVRAEFKAGGAQRDLAIARMGMGTGLGMLVTSWAADGTITGGGPADENARRLLMADGWQPYSIKVGDNYLSYRRLDPLATTLGISTDFVDLQSHMTEKQQENVAALVTASVIQNLANKTWLSGASDLAEAVSDPQRYGDSYMRRMAGSLTTPAASSQLAQTIDPNLREARTILDAVKARIPGASKSLLPQRDVWGDEIVRERALGPADIVNPLPTSTRKNDPLNTEAIEVGATIGKPPRGEMSDKDYNEFLRISGGLMRQAMQARIASPDWKGLTAAERKKAFDTEKKAARKAAKEMLAGGGDAAPAPPAGFELAE